MMTALWTTNAHVVGMMVLRKLEPRASRPYRAWGYPLTPVVLFAMNVWIVTFSLKTNIAAFAASAITLVAGLLAFEVLHRGVGV